MDLRLMQAAATAEERSAIDEVLGPPLSGWDGGDRRAEIDGHIARGGRAARERRHLLLPALHAAQARAGWISEGALNYICARLTVPPAEAYGVAAFYSMFSLEPRPPRVVHVCDDIACRTAGSEEICAELERSIGPEGTPSADGGHTWVRSPCLGLCERAPAALLQASGEDAADVAAAPFEAAEVADLAGGEGAPAPVATPAPQTAEPRDPDLRLLRRVGAVDPELLGDYRAHGGYEALRRALELGPEGVIREVKDSNLLGRGGAAFPAGVKWEAVARTPVRPHYFVCNADESEPGTFKDRVIMEQDPYSVIEALTIAGYATGSEKGFIYIRGEYPTATRRLRNAIEQARLRGLLGEDVMGAEFGFEIEIRRGAGAYICGEETALFNSIEGKRGEPRNKPPFPATHGLFGKPTGINNVETLINVLEVLRIGGSSYADIGTDGSTGTRLFCLSGCVSAPGVYEVAFGTTLRELLDLAGGAREGRELRAVLLGGAAGSFLRPDGLDLPLSFEGTRAAGAALGSGVVMVFDDSVDLTGIVLRIAAFFRDESCGQCVPCRVGTVRQEEAVRRLANGHQNGSKQEEFALLADIAQVMRDASICGLGQTAAVAVESAVSRLGLFGGSEERS